MLQTFRAYGANTLTVLGRGTLNPEVDSDFLIFRIYILIRKCHAVVL
jgi:hypothetical protein